MIEEGGCMMPVRTKWSLRPLVLPRIPWFFLVIFRLCIPCVRKLSFWWVWYCSPARVVIVTGNTGIFKECFLYQMFMRKFLVEEYRFKWRLWNDPRMRARLRSLPSVDCKTNALLIHDLLHTREGHSSSFKRTNSSFTKYLWFSVLRY